MDKRKNYKKCMYLMLAVILLNNVISLLFYSSTIYKSSPVSDFSFAVQNVFFAISLVANSLLLYFVIRLKNWHVLLLLLYWCMGIFVELRYYIFEFSYQVERLQPIIQILWSGWMSLYIFTSPELANFIEPIFDCIKTIFKTDYVTIYVQIAVRLILDCLFIGICIINVVGVIVNRANNFRKEKIKKKIKRHPH